MLNAEELSQFLYSPESRDELATSYFEALANSFLDTINNVYIGESSITTRALVAMSNDILQYPSQPLPETPLLSSLRTQCREIASLIFHEYSGMKLDDEQRSINDSRVLSIIKAFYSRVKAAQSV